MVCVGESATSSQKMGFKKMSKKQNIPHNFNNNISNKIPKKHATTSKKKMNTPDINSHLDPEFEGLSLFEEVSYDSIKFFNKKNYKTKKEGDFIQENKAKKAKLSGFKVTPMIDQSYNEETKAENVNVNNLQSNNFKVQTQAKQNKRKSKISAKPKNKGGSNMKSNLEMNHKVDLLKLYSAWEAIDTPKPVIKALAELGFETPTPIQERAIPQAITYHKDIVGAAETGSGKTLAFGIPIISGILKDKVDDNTQSRDDDDDDEDSSVYSFEDDHCKVDNKLEYKNQEGYLGCVKVIENAKFNFKEEVPLSQPLQNKKLRAVIITPTRELAVQIKNHMSQISKYTDIKLVLIIGGIAHVKQERMLNKGPDIVIGTPGRIWELLQMNCAHLQQISKIKYLAIDETDRMVEKGHFEELKNLLQVINENRQNRSKRQNFVFSATLSTIYNAPIKKQCKMKSQENYDTPTMKLAKIRKLIGIKNKPKIINMTKEKVMPTSLTELKAYCYSPEEKDEFMYYFLKRYPGRSIVFCNSIACVRRLTGIFRALNFDPHPLHASMEQKQRLRHLECFSNNTNALLVATDVAARGLDIPGIDNVIHYQVPRTVESYVHRSGRTARASKKGATILLVEANERNKFQKILSSLQRETDFILFSYEECMMDQIRQIVSLAREIDLEQHKQNKREDYSSLMKMAIDAEICMDDEDKEETKEKVAVNARESTNLKLMKQQLKQLLAKPFIPQNFSAAYPTQSGTFIPLISGFEGEKAYNAGKPKASAKDMLKPLNKQKLKNKI